MGALAPVTTPGPPVAGDFPAPPATSDPMLAPIRLSTAPAVGPRITAPVPDQIADLMDRSSLAGDLEAAPLQFRQLIPAARAGLALNEVQASQAIRDRESLASARQTLAEMQAATPTIPPDQLEAWQFEMKRVAGEIAAAEAKQAQPEYVPAMERVAESEQAGFETLAETLPEIVSRSMEISRIPMNPAARAVGEAESFGEGLSAAGDDPLWACCGPSAS
jgi:hypothetical protein